MKRMFVTILLQNGPGSIIVARVSSPKTTVLALAPLSLPALVRVRSENGRHGFDFQANPCVSILSDTCGRKAGLIAKKGP